jgi:hypothetical protein
MLETIEVEGQSKRFPVEGPEGIENPDAALEGQIRHGDGNGRRGAELPFEKGKGHAKNLLSTRNGATIRRLLVYGEKPQRVYPFGASLAHCFPL